MPTVPFGRDAVAICKVEAVFTVCVKLPMLAEKLVSPLYSAVIGLAPVPVKGTVRVAWLPVTVIAPDPMVTPLFLKITVPPGLPAAEELIVAVRVTFCPTADGLMSLVKAVKVLAGVIVSVPFTKVKL